MNLSKATNYADFLERYKGDVSFLSDCYERASKYISELRWITGVENVYVGLHFDGMFCVFLFETSLNVDKKFPDDEFIWIVVGDLPIAYITSEVSPNPACALDSYVGAMFEWVEAVETGASVSDLIPVNVPPTTEYAAMLRTRLELINDLVLSQDKFKKDLSC